MEEFLCNQANITTLRPLGCRQCHVNYIFEQGLKGVLKPSASLEVGADPMY